MILGLAPMDGVTNLPYRTIVQRVFDRYGEKDKQTLWTWTEFMNADGYLVQPHRLAHHFVHHESETNLIVQIYGGTHQTLLATARDIDKKYGSHIGGIELNIGCPSPRVMACGGGSALMRDYEYLTDIVKEISESIQSPFSIKVRSGLRHDDKDKRFLILAHLAQFCDTVTIHGRTFSSGHAGPNDRDYICRYQETVGDQCRVIGNGGISTYEETLTHQLDGVMIGQAAIGNPWIFTPHEPAPADRYDVIMEHVHLLLAYEYRKGTHIPEEYKDDATHQNKSLLHARKKGGDIGDDTRYDVEKIRGHDFVLEMPNIDELDKIASRIGDYVDLSADHQGLVEFRKYLFNYLAGLPGSKELKKTLAGTKRYDEMREAIDLFFGV